MLMLRARSSDLPCDRGLKVKLTLNESMKKTRMAIMMFIFGVALKASASLDIINGDFESPVTTTATYTYSIPGWDMITGGTGGNGGVWNIVDYAPTYWNSLPPPDGKQVGWLSVGPGPANPTTIAQTLTSTVLVGTTYTFTGYAGHPIGFGASQTPGTYYTVAILAGGDVVASFSNTGPEGSFEMFSVSWTGDATHFGQLLGVQLGSSQAQSAFDKLSMTAVPETSTIIAGALLLLPFGASTVRILRKKRTA
jgi:HpiC1 cyclase